MHYFSNLFHKCFGQVHYPSTGVSQHCIHAIGICHASSVGCLLAQSRLRTADRQQNQNDKYLLRVYSVEILLLMDSEPVRNMQSTLSNKYEKQCISLALIVRIYHVVRSSECQNWFNIFPFKLKLTLNINRIQSKIQNIKIYKLGFLVLVLKFYSEAFLLICTRFGVLSYIRFVKKFLFRCTVLLCLRTFSRA